MDERASLRWRRALLAAGGVAIAAGMGAATPARPAPDADLDRIVRLWAAATGGLDRIRAIRALRMSGQITFSGKPPCPITVELARPGKIRTQVAFSAGNWIQIFDGRQGWIVTPFGMPPGTRPMSADEAANAPEQADFEGPLVDSARKGIRLALEGKVKVDGRDAWRIRVTRRDGAVRWLDLDAATSLRVGWEGELGEGADRKMNASIFSDYRTVAGLAFPFRIASGIARGDITQRIAFDRIEVDPPIPDSDFAPPK